MAESTGGSQALVISRVFNVARDKVWQAWADPQLVMRWWGPKGFTAPVCKADFRVDGKYLYCMRSPEGKDFWSTGIYQEIVPMERIVFTDNFADEQGNVVPASYYGMADLPNDLVVTITLEEIEGDKTKFTLRHEGLLEGEMKEQSAVGWNEFLDKLAEILK
ncbi:MAG: SRPBCC domain-containing protein [Candidatus Abawacabacteria bacterium]|nr:SRPBCC domain-containing protein [Candidatus Abawacabacteria bacterium]